MSARDQLEPAFILHRRPYRESSLLVEMLMPSRGRVGVVARGARGARSRWRGVLEPFRGVLVSLGGRGELHTLTGAEPVGPPPRLNGTRLASAFYLSELVIRLVRRDDPSEALFAAYSLAIEGLSTGAAEARTLRLFEKHLLATQGYGMGLEQRADGRELRADAWYRYVPGNGLEVGRHGDADSCSGEAVMALASESEVAGDELFLQARRITTAALAPLLGGRPLQSRDLYRGMRQRAANAADATPDSPLDESTRTR